MNVQISKLTSGLKIVTEELSHLQTAAIGVWVNVGSRHELQSHNGVAHFLEHMMFKGTHRANAKQIAERIENIGGYVNAFTTREVTAYYTRVLSQDYQMALDTLSDVLQFSTFDTHELEKERKVILQEISESNDTPDDLVFDLFQKTAYPDQSIGRAILGTSEIIQNIPRTDLVKFYTQNYTFQNMVLSAVGNVRHQDIVNFAEQKFTHLTSDFSNKAFPSNYQGGLCIQNKDLEQVHFVLGFPAPAFMQDGYFSCAVLSTLFGGGMSSRLFQQVRENLGLAYSVYSFHTGFSDTGLFGIYAGTSQKDIGQLLPTLYTEIQKVTYDLDIQEIQKAKTQLKANLMMGLESTSTRCEQMASQLLIHKAIFNISDLVKRIDEVSLEDVIICAQKIFCNQPTMAVLGPVEDHAIIQKYYQDFRAY